MTSGLVYLRPKHVVFYRAHGPFRDSGPVAWTYVRDWIARHGAVDEVATGYGLASYGPVRDGQRQPRYEACIELPMSIDVSEIEDMRFQDLPGGAYARRRYVGPFGGVGKASKEFRESWFGDYGLCADRRRPLVEIYLDHPEKVSPDKLRIDLCMPVAVERASRAA